VLHLGTRQGMEQGDEMLSDDVSVARIGAF